MRNPVNTLKVLMVDAGVGFYRMQRYRVGDFFGPVDLGIHLAFKHNALTIGAGLLAGSVFPDDPERFPTLHLKGDIGEGLELRISHGAQRSGQIEKKLLQSPGDMMIKRIALADMIQEDSGFAHKTSANFRDSLLKTQYPINNDNKL